MVLGYAISPLYWYNITGPPNLAMVYPYDGIR